MLLTSHKKDPTRPVLPSRSNNVATLQCQASPPRAIPWTQFVPIIQAQKPSPQGTYPRPQGGVQPRSLNPPPGFQRNQPRFNQGQQGCTTQAKGFTHVPKTKDTPQAPLQSALVPMIQQALRGHDSLTTTIADMEARIEQLQSQRAPSPPPNQPPSNTMANRREHPHINEDIAKQEGEVELVHEEALRKEKDAFAASKGRGMVVAEARRMKAKIVDEEATTKPKYIPPPPYVPPLPFPGRFKKQITEKESGQGCTQGPMTKEVVRQCKDPPWSVPTPISLT